MFLTPAKMFAPGLLVTIVCMGAGLPLAASGQTAPLADREQTIPAKPSADVPLPESLPVTQPTAVSDSVPVRGSERTSQKLDVDYRDGKIVVDATNASLSRVVGDIAAKAEIKVTGNVSEERVFGHYGPAAPSVILATLLDGTGSNMLLIDDAKGGSELILTQRIGGPTPPNPLAAAAERLAEQQDDERPNTRLGLGRPFQGGPGRGPLVVPPNVGAQFQTGRPGGLSGVPPGGDLPEPSQSSDPRTPQQIYDQLQNQKSSPIPPQ